jgi:hypothetical protein
MGYTVQSKKEQLGMPFGTANGILRKNIIYSMAKMLNMDICFHCGEIIDDIQKFSIEHKIPYLYSDNPSDLFFDFENIAFSHISCNVKMIRRKKPQHGKSQMYRNGCRCVKCRKSNADAVAKYRSNIKGKNTI